jgi:hypothetical protein
VALATAVAALLLQPLAMVRGQTATADSLPGDHATTASTPALSAEGQASKQAAQSGSPVLVEADTTATDTVTALPDGTFRLDADTVPVRVEQAGSWVPVDTSLQVQPDGSLKPHAAPVSMVFSGGGSTAPLVTMVQGAASYAISAPWSLPVPTVSGSTATYASVLPDVDLIVTALPDGFAENVVVKTRQAAADPQLESLRFPVSEQGLSVKNQDAGGAVLVDGQGRPVFSTGSALAWDSSNGSSASGTSATATKANSPTRDQDVAGPADTAVAPGPESKTSVMDVDLTATAMTVTPDPDFLADPSTVFPVVLDPQTVSQSLASWTATWSGQPNTSFWKTSHSLGVGYDLPEDTKIVRSIYQFDTHGVEGKKVLSATFTAEEVWSYNCTKKPVELWHTGGISSATSWARPPTWMSKVDTVSTAKGWSSDCPGGNVEFDATNAVAYSADRDGATTTVGLRASDETDAGAWKQFASPADTKPVLSVTFVSAPKMPSQSSLRLSQPKVACGIDKAAAVKISDLGPYLSAVPLSADGSQSTLRPNFEVHRYDPDIADPVVASGSPSAWTTSGQAATWHAVNASGAQVLQNNQTYWFRVRTQYQYSYNGTTGSMYSGWTAGCWFTIDTTAPPKPTISSSQYPECATADDPDTCTRGGGVGVPGTFTLTPGASDVVSYSYSLNDGKSTTEPIATPLVVTPNRERINKLRVQTVDGAGNTSDDATYEFSVAPGPPAVDDWSFTEGSGPSAADSLGAHTATLGTGAAWTGQGRIGSALSLTGQNGSYAAATATGLDTSASFTVSAWARLSTLDQTAVVLSQNASHSSSFSLYYSPAYGQWIFNRNSADSTAPTITRSIGTSTPMAGVWTHLVGVYDKDAQTIQLYVNGVAQGDPVAFTTPWKSTGPLEFGQGQYKDGSSTNFFPGQIDEVQVWNRILLTDEIGDLEKMADPAQQVDSQPALVADWTFTDGSGTTAEDMSGYDRDAILGGGVTWTDDSVAGNVLQLDGASDAHASVPAPVVDATGDFTASVWVDIDQNAVADTSVAHTMRILGQSGSTHDSWGLWYTQPAGQSEGAWVFGRTSDDTANATTTTAPDDPSVEDAAEVGTWTLLTATYDAVSGTMELYVNGQPKNAASDDPDSGGSDGTPFTSPWQAAGPLTIGTGQNGTGGQDPTTGMVSRIRIWTGLVPVDDILQQGLMPPGL